MVLGHGVDIVDGKRIRGLVDKYGDHFIDKVFTPAEKRYCSGMAQAYVHYAGRWAAKEAFYKALPDSIQPRSGWKSIEILPVEQGRRPRVFVLSAEVEKGLCTAGISKIELSISHDHDLCIASVILC